jgi:hypothetical protein
MSRNLICVLIYHRHKRLDQMTTGFNLNSMVQISYWECLSYLVGQLFLYLVWNWKVHLLA